MPKMVQKRFVIITVTKKIKLTISFQLSEKKHLPSDISIEKLIDISNKTETILYKIVDELKEFENQKIDDGRDKFKQPIQRAGTDDIVQGPRRASKKPRFLSK